MQLRPWLPPEISGLHWLALGVTAQSVFVPFYASLTETPTDYQRGTATFSWDSAYWRYKLLGVLVDPHYPLFGEKLATLQKNLRVELNHRVRESDHYALQMNADAGRLAYLTKISHENAALARNQVNQLIAELITAATDLSPLNFTTDENL